MSTNLNYKQVANITRRTWDVETYEKRAKERAQNEDSGSGGVAGAGGVGPVVGQGGDDDAQPKEEFTPAAQGAAGPHLSQRAFLKARKKKVEGLDSKVGQVEMINPDAVAVNKSVDSGASADAIDPSKAVIKSGVGWHCKVCDCFLKDSLTYLDHINGRKHQRALGYSMRVERSTTSQVSSRLAELAQQHQQAKQAQKQSWTMSNNSTTSGSENKTATSSKYDDLDEAEDDMYHSLVKAKDEELRRKKEERKRERKERKKLKKMQQQQQHQEDEEDEGGDAGEDEQKQTARQNGDGQGDRGQQQQEDEEDDVEEECGVIDPNLAAMMGFSGFGSTGK